MKFEGQAVPPDRQAPIRSGQATISLFPAVLRIPYLIFGRISHKAWGLLVLTSSLALLFTVNNQLSPTLNVGLNRLEGLSLPSLINTVNSPQARNLTTESILEANGLVSTPKGNLEFKSKVKMFATSYDQNCSGCNETTATGMKTGFGVVAVDPNVIPLGSKVFVPGYGVAVAGDTGGSIKGNRIDLGFDNVKNGWWSARFVDVYVLK